MRYRSFAEWPSDVFTASDGSNISTDDHDTEEQASAVCVMLKLHGFGGGGVKPIRTWVKPVDDAATAAASG